MSRQRPVLSRLSIPAAIAAELGHESTAADLDSHQLRILHWTFGRELPQSWGIAAS